MRALLSLLLLVHAPALAQETTRAPRAEPRPGVGAEDPRRPADVRAAPWDAVGRLQTETGLRCTGALVGPSTVLTAAHCLLGAEGFVRPSSVHFLLGYDRGSWRGAARGVALTVAADYQRHRGPAGADWALVALDRPLAPPGRVLPLLREPPEPGAALMLGGYQRDRPEVLLADTGCRALGIAGAGAIRSLAHDCAGTRGSSGAPVLARGPDGAWAIAGVSAAVAVGDAAPFSPRGFAALAGAIPPP